MLIATNHLSEWDPILIRAALPFFTPLAPTYYVSSPKEDFRSFGWKYFIYGGFFFEIYGAYSIRPGKKDYEYSLQTHIEILKKGHTLCIFPQGGLTKPEEIGKIHGGVAFLAHTTNTAVTPAYIYGTYKISLKEFLSFKKKVVITFGEKMYHKDIFQNLNPTVDDMKHGANLIMNNIVSLR